MSAPATSTNSAISSAQERYAERLARLDRLANLLDRKFGIPGTRLRFGWDSLLGLIPGVGDTVALLPGVYILVEGYRLGAGRGALIRMAGNTLLDYAVGSIPLAGDLFDVWFKANRRNVTLLRRDLGATSDLHPPVR